jgi:Transglycosylase SLT domain
MTTRSGVSRRASLFVTSIGVLALVVSPTNVQAKSSDAATPVARYALVLRSFNPTFSASQSRDMAAHVLLLSSYYSLDPRLLVAMVGVESSWQSGAVSHSGAQGLGQLMPSTASGLGVLSFDAYENLDGTARYLRRMMQQFAGFKDAVRYALALASYNAGPQAVARYGGIPPYAETQAYVAHVLASWRHLETLLPASGDVSPAVAPSTPKPIVALRHVAAPQATILGGSVAEFMQLDSESVQDYVIASAQTPAPRQPASLRRWFSRAFPRH